MDTVKKSGRHIDHVFYTTNSVKVLSWKLITDNYDGKFGSDHLPIMADVLIAN
jgi:endonuclease/exonuclease/phosphatase family metal-dependent hydrolase